MNHNNTGKVEGRQHSVHEISGIRSNIHVQFGVWQIEIMILSQVILIPVFFPQYTMELLFFLSYHWPHLL